MARITTLQMASKITKQLKEDKKDLRNTLKNIRKLTGEESIKLIIDLTLQLIKK